MTISTLGKISFNNSITTPAKKLLCQGAIISTVTGTLLAAATKISAFALPIFPLLALVIGVGSGLALISYGVFTNFKSPINNTPAIQSNFAKFDPIIEEALRFSRKNQRQSIDELNRNVVLKGRGMNMIRDNDLREAQPVVNQELDDTQPQILKPRGFLVVGIDNKPIYKTKDELIKTKH